MGLAHSGGKDNGNIKIGGGETLTLLKLLLESKGNLPCSKLLHYKADTMNKEHFDTNTMLAPLPK